MDAKKFIMLLLDFKKNFFLTLLKQYPKTEINSFFKLLIEYKLGLNRIETALNTTLVLKKNEELFLKNALEKLKKQVPIQYIIGETEFYGLKFFVNKNVLIPRPETEELVQWIIENTSKNKPISILDIGTGSGCVAISLAINLPNATVFALDISEKALKTATKNAKQNIVDIQFIKEDILQLNKLPQKFDIIVSNPPYVRELEKIKMQPNVLKNEPHLALFVKDANPLLFYEKITKLASIYLNKNGQLFFEINQYLGKQMVELVQSNNYKEIELKKDFYEVDRMLRAILKN